MDLDPFLSEDFACFGCLVDRSAGRRMSSSSIDENHPHGPKDSAPHFSTHPIAVLRSENHCVPLPPGRLGEGEQASIIPVFLPGSCPAPRAHLGPGFSRDKGMLISSLYCSLLSRTSSHAWTWHSGMRQRELLVATSLSPVGECNVPSRERGGRGGEGEGNESITPCSPAPCQPVVLCTLPEAEVSSASRRRERRHHRFCSHGLSCSFSPP